MLSPVSLRICWIATMAPALTEAASQAENFNLPASSNLNFASPSLNKLGDLSLQTLSDIVGGKHKPSPKLSSGSEDLINESQIQKCRLSWKVLHADTYSNGNHSGLPFNGHNGVDRNTIVQSKRPVGLTPNSDPAGRTMNKNNHNLQDNMGLIKANTSLECQNKLNSLGTMRSQVTQKTIGSLDRNKTFPVSERNYNTPIRRLTENENFKNFQWSKMPKEEISNGEQISDINSQNCWLKSRARQVLRRIRKLQLRQIECHTKGQLRSFVEHEQRFLGIPCQRQLETSLLRARNTEELKAELLQNEDVKLLSTAALVNLVRKLEHGTSLTQSRSLCEAILNKDRRKVLTKINSTECPEIKRTTGILLGHIHHLESAADSDATESSSGGESTDELSDFEEMNRPDLLSKRQAAISWAEDRAAAASQWTWLQAQVSELEYKIRQQNDLYRQVRASKGAVTLEGGRRDCGRPTFEPAAESDVPKSVNGFLDGVSNGYSAMRRLMGETDSPKLLGSEAGSESCRTRPLKRVFRKRKLVRTVGLHLTSRKTSRLSSIKCGCNSQRELLPCVLCGGRYNNTQTLDPDVMPLTERIALLDSSYHMVLSFKQEIPLSLHFEKMLRRAEYCKALKISFPIKKKARLSIQQLSLSDRARKHSRKLTKNAAQTLLTSAKLRKKLGSQTRRNKHGRFLLSSREDPSYRKKFKTLAAYRRQRARRRSGSFSSESSKPGSPVPSPFPYDSGGKVSSLQELLRRRRLESAYDINNIVIPYSIAATTRVEKLQYKEILTPKWRLVEPSENSPENETTTGDELEVEDISDEAISIRHLKCELEEKKRFLGYKQMHGRSRLRSIRGDSRADSSGANTPDPMSPYPADSYSHDSYGWNSPVASPPPPPAPVVVQMEEHGLPPLVRPERRRTISLTKRLSEDERSSLGGDDVPATPYELRVFPLADEDYQEMLHASSHLDPNPRDDNEDPTSPVASSTSESVPEEDPNDPEWTVVAEDKNQKPSLILKLAKR